MRTVPRSWIGLASAVALLLAAASSAEGQGRAVGLDRQGRLVYEAGALGDRVPDFSHAGYGGGGVPIPDAPIVVVVEPGPGDDGPRIQAAIDFVSRAPVVEQGLRGAVLLRAGRYEIEGQLTLKSGGVVLRGAGDGPEGTVLVATGTDRRTLIRIRGEAGPLLVDAGAGIAVINPYVPVGSNRLRVASTEGLDVGSTVFVDRPGTAEWIATIGMDDFPPGGGKSWLDWKPGRVDLRADRTIVAREGDAIVLDAPLTTALDARLGGGRVVGHAWPGRSERIGIEDLRCESEFDPDNPKDEQHAWGAVAIDDARDVWVRGLTAVHFAGWAVRVDAGASRVTVQDCESLDPISEVGGYRRHTFYTAGQQTLFLRCRSERGRHDFAVGYLSAGPNAFVECEATGALGFSGPIESWASGVLFDNVRMDGGGLALTNREIDGHGAGWSAANSVLWQCSAPVITCRTPAGAHNWAFGCWGQFVGDGSWSQINEFVDPESLYRAQLADRLGKAALAALDRRPIPTDPGLAPSNDDLPAETHPDPVDPSHPIVLRNGWITADGALVVGGRTGTAWWRGHTNPLRRGETGIGLTRFVPGIDGPGATDDLDQLTDAMVAGGTTVLEHNYGLWYDRRRDDHEMIRRIDGDVWPPFYELPWARSGRGTAWDGLSRYDLESFNPWYFARLQRFADLCEQKGLVLVHDAYFQHNILEAGAHWVDFPWRPANCIQETGFPEPPPFAGGKRIFMAKAFYDVEHPVRRRLHQHYIRHYLDALGGRPNILFQTGEEFTGPEAFVRFWMETVIAWERETGKDVLISLSCTKDVQDAILADPELGPEVSVIDQKYWWYTADGGVYDPAGGQDLAPRQQLREWRGGKSRSEEQTARQVREYRDTCGKAVIVSSGASSPWAILAAGGSLPDLPGTTDRRLLEAIARMNTANLGGPADGPRVLGNREGEFFLYSGRGGPFQLGLPEEHAPYLVRRIDPKTGRVHEAEGAASRVDHLDFSTQGSGALVLWVTPASRNPDP